MSSNMENNDWNFGNNLNSNDFEIASKEDTIPKAIIWHEMGHVFGDIIANSVGDNFGTIKEIVFTDKPYVKFENNCGSYFYEGKELAECRDFYGQRNRCIDENITVKVAAFDKSRILAYILYLTFGGLFNIYACNDDPAEQDFDDCFIDDYKNCDLSKFYACGGNDWSKCRIVAGNQKLHLGKIIEFRNTLFFLLIECDVFKKLDSFINNVYIKYSGAKLSDGEAINLYRESKLAFSSLVDIDFFILKIKNLIEQTSKEI